jgi:mannosyltransferase
MEASLGEAVAEDVRHGWGPGVARKPVTWLVAAASTCAAGALYFLFIGRQSFWEDEGASWFFAHDGLRGVAQAAWRHDPNMTLYYVLLNLWLHAGLGDSEAAIRALSAIFALITVPLIYLLGSRLFSPWSGAVAAVLFASNSFIVEYAQEARAYVLVTFLVTLSSYLFVLELERPTRGARVGYVLASALAVYAQFFAAWVLIAQAVALVALRGRASIGRRWKASFGMILVLCLPAAGQILRFRHGTIAWVPQPTLSRFGRSLDLLAGGSWMLLVLALIATAYAAFYAVRTGRNRWQTGFVLIWLVLPVVLVFILSYVTPLLVPRYLIVVVPALSLATGAGIAALASDRRFAIAAVAVLVGLLALSGVQLHRWYTLPQREDWRDATRYVLREQRAGDGIVFQMGGGKRPFAYYAHRYGEAGPKLLETTSTALHVPSGRIWFVRLHLSPNDPSITALVHHLAVSGYRLRRSREIPAPRARFAISLYAQPAP